MPTTDVVEPAPSSLLLSDRPAWRLVLALGWPVLLQQLLLYAVMIYDALLAGHFKPPSGSHVAAQSAQTTAIYLAWCVTSYTVLVSVGGTALVARFTGAGDRALAVRVTNQSILLAVLLGLSATAAGLVWMKELLALLQLRGEAAEFAAEYLRPLFILLVFQVVESAGIACLVGAGDTRIGLWILGGVAVINMPLARLFVYGLGPVPGLGFAGIATGTAVSHVLGALAVLTVLARGRAGLRLNVRQLWPDLRLLRRLLRVSLPAGLDSLTVAVGQLWFLSVVNRLSADESGAHGIALRCEALSFLTGTAFGTAAMTLVGQNLGAGRPDRAARDTWTAFGLSCLVMCLCGVVFFTLAPQMFALFCPYKDQQGMIAAGVPVLRLIAFAMPPLACTIVFTAALRGAGDTRVPVLFTLVGFFLIRIPLAHALTGDHVNLGPLGVWPGHNMGLIGAWLAMSADVFVRGAFFLYRFASGRWKRIEV